LTASSEGTGCSVPLADNTRDVYDGLAALYVPIAAAVFVVIVVSLAWLVWRGRRRAAPTGPDDATRTEIAYAAVLAAIVVVLLVATFRAVDRENARAAGAPEVIRVTAAKWNWRFAYPREGKVETGGSNGAPATLVVPAGVQVEFQATSIDVLHGFWIPALKFQRQLVPGESVTFRLTFPRPGFTESGTCSFYCGLEHARMRFAVQVLSGPDFRRWATS
jgi:cytochrome c oxidase subunit II